MRIAKETHQSVLAMNDDTSVSPGTAGEIPTSMKSAELGRFDETGTWQSDNKTVAVNGNTAAGAQSTANRNAAADQNRTMSNAAPSPMARADNAAPRATAGTSGARPARKRLPRTASGLALYELISGLALAGGFAVRQLRSR
jgi:hypothetical protein